MQIFKRNSVQNGLVKNSKLRRMKKDWQLYVLFAIPLLYYIIFHYIPMCGVIIAFKDYSIFDGIFGSDWIGLENFKYLLQLPDFLKAVRNTLIVNGLEVFFSFPIPIFLALCLNEIANLKFKKISQTVLYLPHFLSWIIIGGIVYQLFATNTGAINTVLGTSIPFLSNKYYWLITYIVSGIWQSAGWNTIIYLAAISGIDPSLYEAVEIDGGGKFTKMWHITLPSIKSTIVVLLIMKLGSLMSIGFEKPYVLGNALVTDFSEVISTFVYRIGLQGGLFGYSTAAGFFQSVVGLILIISANFVSKKLGEGGIW